MKKDAVGGRLRRTAFKFFVILCPPHAIFAKTYSTTFDCSLLAQATR
jgi:hypothetical protein